jgi:hypothetical protein
VFWFYRLVGADLRVKWRFHLGHRIGIGDIKDTRGNLGRTDDRS